MFSRISLFTVIGLLYLLGTSQGATIHVPDDYPTIQSAIDASVNGDTVLVQPGTYVENIDFLGKGIKVKSALGPEVTIIDGGNPTHPDFGSVVSITNGWWNKTILYGFTLTNGTGTYHEYVSGKWGYCGGGIFALNSSATITNNIITGNMATHGGGIGYFQCSQPVIDKNKIIGNTANRGGGILVRYSTNLTITNNIISENSAVNNGGGICCDDSHPIIKNNILCGNHSNDLGGGVFVRLDSYMTLINNTITGNTANTQGGGILCQGNTNAIISNTILWKNEAPSAKEICIYGKGSISIFYSDVEGGQSAVHTDPMSDLYWGVGMIDGDPLFTDPVHHDFHLRQDPCQPGVVNQCVDSGDPASSTYYGTTRTDGDQDEGIFDMGYHYALPPDNDGILYIPSEYSSLQLAIEISMDGETILVSPGTYVENIDILGKGITIKSEQGPSVTVIDGNQAGSVVKCQSGEGSDTIIDGFTITNGRDRYGGGMYNENSNPMVKNCKFYNNEAYQLLGSGGYGGGMFNGHVSNPEVTACLFYGNRAIDNYPSHGPWSCGGGGMANWEGSKPEVTNCSFIENTSDGIYNDYSSPTVTDCTFTDNSRSGMRNVDESNPTVTSCLFSRNVAGKGGGMKNMCNSNPMVTNCIFSGNMAYNCGGGMYNENCCPILTNCTFLENLALYRSGGMENVDYSHATVTNTIFWNNEAPEGSEIGIYGNASLPSVLTIAYSAVKGGLSSFHVDPGCTVNWGAGMIDSDPLFIENGHWNNNGTPGDPYDDFWMEGDCHLTFNSPCRGSGDSSAVTALVDFEGDPRIAYGTVDIGADEFHTHLYWTGDATPGGSVEVKHVGLPGTSPVFLCVGTGVLDSPLHTLHGEWYLDFPIILTLGMGSITTPEGVSVLPFTFDPGFPAMDIPMQSLIGTELTNLCVMEVQ